MNIRKKVKKKWFEVIRWISLTTEIDSTIVFGSTVVVDSIAVVGNTVVDDRSALVYSSAVLRLPAVLSLARQHCCVSQQCCRRQHCCSWKQSSYGWQHYDIAGSPAGLGNTHAVVAMIGSNAAVGSPAVVGSTAVVLLLNSLCHRAPNFSPHIPHSEEEGGGLSPSSTPPSWVQPG